MGGSESRKAILMPDLQPSSFYAPSPGEAPSEDYTNAINREREEYYALTTSALATPTPPPESQPQPD